MRSLVLGHTAAMNQSGAGDALPVGRPLTAAPLFTRLAFDGETLEITSRLRPSPRGRTTRIPLSDLMAIEAWSRDRHPGVDGTRQLLSFRVRRYWNGEQITHHVRVMRKAPTADFRRLQEGVNEAVVDRARRVIDARGQEHPSVRTTGTTGSGPRSPTDCARPSLWPSTLTSRTVF